MLAALNVWYFEDFFDLARRWRCDILEQIRVRYGQGIFYDVSYICSRRIRYARPVAQDNSNVAS